MKYTFAWLLMIFFVSSSYGQGQVVNLYNQDSTLMGNGVMLNNKMDGLWKFINPKTNRLIQQGNFKNGLKDGEWTIYFSNKQKHIVAEYKDNKRNGSFLEYDLGGALIKNAVYQDSVLVGPYKEYYGNQSRSGYANPKQVKTEGNYINGKKTGEWVFYYDNGKKAVEINYEEGLKVGPYKEYDPFDQLVVEANYTNNQPDGEFKRFSPNGRIQESGEYNSGRRVGKWTSYFPNTNIVESVKLYDKSGHKTGTWTYFYENKRTARVERYENDIPVGKWEEFFTDKSLSKQVIYDLGVPTGKYIENHSNGKPSVRGQYENGFRSGVWKSYYPEGNLFSIGEYKNDLKSGLWKYFNKIGILVAEGKYQLGNEHGQWFYYYDGGQLKSVGSYLLGQEDGIWGLFYDNKQLTQEETWDFGRLLNISEYNNYNGSKTLNPGTLRDGNGTRITYYINGAKESEGNYQSGKPEGNWKYYHDNGRLASEGKMVDGKKEGPWKYYTRSGNLEDIIQFDDDEVLPNEIPEESDLFQDFD
ncbi:hypothetical protein GCM10027284_11810 [Cyclobacterium sediminis]